MNQGICPIHNKLSQKNYVLKEVHTLYIRLIILFIKLNNTTSVNL
jgi:hypothetical protein